MPKCKIRSKVAHFYFVLFVYNCFTFVGQILWSKKTCYGLRTLLRTQQHLPPFLINFRIDMVDFVDSHKVVVKRNAFLAFPSARDGVESECTKVESERLKRQFSQVEGDLDL